ncbi:peptidase family M28-domain-containing protein [Chaetomium tenue]|uniref:Peptidase family M28-domain-containing protein n=1 Tax=Chaetomium tenue TaxID=1854479 RepID=A0ACB7PTW8_9PEZI|nr:peptidase family M28-domain-containing protein [Chaetomium globosum]
MRHHLPSFLLLLTTTTTTLAYTPLSDTSLHHLLSPPPSSSPQTTSDINTNPDPDFDPHHGALLAPILQPRVPGTPGHARVQEHFLAFVRAHLHPDWTVEWHNSTATTPATGDTAVPFQNLILRRDPPWLRTSREGEGEVARLTLAAHYDSLYRPEGFVGAVDSAVPCALLLAVARGVDEALTRRWEGTVEEGMEGMGEESGVQILLLDGEEAWVQWSAADSLYGSRALAESWETTRYDTGSRFSTPLEAISLFVLLDLLGAADPNIPSYFPTTHWAYRHLAKIEGRLRRLGVLETKPKRSFLAESEKEEIKFRGFVEDDHVPFMKRGVDILHVIPTPFPPVWHTMDDNAAHLDVPTIRDWAKIMTAFVAEWMDVEGYVPEAGARPEAEKAEHADSEKEEL